MLDDQHLFTATDLKQFTYCPRIFFYMRCLPRVRPITYKMEAGIEEHEREQQRASRRNLSQYDEPVGSGSQREFDVMLKNQNLGVQGMLDEVVTTTKGEIFPVDYKMTDKIGEHFKQQLTLYALLLETERQTNVRRGFLYLIPTRRMEEVRITPALRQQVTQALGQMSQIVTQEAMPDPTPQRRRCIDCEFRRFCNDVV